MMGDFYGEGSVVCFVFLFFFSFFLFSFSRQGFSVYRVLALKVCTTTPSVRFVSVFWVPWISVSFIVAACGHTNWVPEWKAGAVKEGTAREETKTDF